MNTIFRIDIPSIVDSLKTAVDNLIELPPSYENIVHVNGIAIYVIEEVLSGFTGEHMNITDFNGHDQDWSTELTYKNVQFQAWGSGMSGGFIIKKK